MDLQKLIDKGELVKLPVDEKCVLLTKEVTVKQKGEDKITIMENGPCRRITNGECDAYIDPTSKWRLGNCGLATHTFQEDEVKKFILNPIKASKKGRG